MNTGNRFSIPGLFFMAACILEGYFLLEYRSIPALIAVGGVLVLAAAYVFMNVLWSEYENRRAAKWQEQQDFIQNRIEEKWKEMEKIQKAMYVVTKHFADDMQEGMEHIKAELEAGHKLSEQHMEEVLKSGENGVKLLIKYNRMDAKKIAGFHKKEYETITDAIQNNTETLEQSLKENRTAIQNMKASSPVVTTVPIEEAVPAGEQTSQPEIEESVLNMTEETVSETIGTETAMEGMAGDIPAQEKAFETVAEMEIPNIETIETPTEIVMDEVELPEDLSMKSEEEVELESEAVMEPKMIEESEPIVEAEAIADPVIEDPNKMMSPDDIAALLASMNN